MAPDHHGYQRACDLISGQASSWTIRVTSVRVRREDRSPFRLILSQTSAGKGLLATSSIVSLLGAVPWFAPGGCSFVPACSLQSAPRAGAVKAGRRAYVAACSSVARPRLDGAEHGARIKQVGTPSHRSSRTRRHALCREPPRRCERACWPVQWRARWGAVAASPPRSKI